MYPRVSAITLDMTHPLLHLLSEPGAAGDDGGAPQSVPGRVWVARVIPSQLSQSEASIVPSDQSEAIHHSSRGNTKTISHRPQTDLANIYFYQSQ